MPSPTQADAPFVAEGSGENFQSLVIENSRRGPVLVNFWSPKAGPCLRLYPVLDQLIHALGGRVLLVNIDTDAHRPLARQVGVTSVPTLKLVVGGQVVETLHGYQNESELRAMLGRHLPRESDAALAEALRLYQSGDTERALMTLADAALEDPANLRIPLALAKLLVRESRHREAFKLLSTLPAEQQEEPDVRDLWVHLGFLLAAQDAPAPEVLSLRVDTDPQDLEARYLLCAHRLIQDDYPAALELLAEILRHDPDYRQGIARKALLALLGMVEDRELRARYREELNRYHH